MTKTDCARAPDSRQRWVFPRVQRLVASEAELNPVFTTDIEGTS